MLVLEENNNTKEKQKSEFESFYAWFNEKQYKPAMYNDKSTVEKWYNTVQKNHKQIREILGGETAEYNVAIDEEKRSLSDDIIGYYKDSLTDYLPNLFKDNPSLDLNKETVEINGKSIGLVKFISTYAKKQRCIYSATILDILSKLSEEQKNMKIKEMSLKIRISTDPKDFLSLGTFDVDYGSCFTDGHANDAHKYTIGETKNSFIIIGEDDEGERIFRCWGWMVKNTVYMLNFYLRKKNINLEEAEIFCQSIAEELLGGPVNKKANRGGKVKKIPQVYTNAESGVMFSKKKE